MEPLPNYAIKFDATKVFTDSSAAKVLAMNKQDLVRTENIGVKYHFVKQSISGSNVFMRNVLSNDSLANILTKILDFSAILQ